VKSFGGNLDDFMKYQISNRFGPFFDKSGKNSDSDLPGPTECIKSITDPFFGPFCALRLKFRPLGNPAHWLESGELMVDFTFEMASKQSLQYLINYR
jgi:hypothetical protein